VLLAQHVLGEFLYRESLASGLTDGGERRDGGAGLIHRRGASGEDAGEGCAVAVGCHRGLLFLCSG